MSVENNPKPSDCDETTYDKAKAYWQTVEPSICGMLGGIPEVGFIGKHIKINLYFWFQ